MMIDQPIATDASTDVRSKVTKLRLAVRLAAIAALIFLVTVSLFSRHKLAAVGLASMTVSGLLITPEILETFARPGLLAMARKRNWQKDLLVVGILITVAASALMALGGSEGHLTMPNSSGRETFLVGVFLAICALVCFSLVWLIRLLRDIADTLDDPGVRKSLEEAEHKRWPLALGAVLFVLGTLLQFIGTASG
jgi:hypothetical protein